MTHDDVVQALAFSPAGQTLFSGAGDSDTTIKAWCKSAGGRASVPVRRHDVRAWPRRPRARLLTRWPDALLGLVGQVDHQGVVQDAPEESTSASARCQGMTASSIRSPSCPMARRSSRARSTGLSRHGARAPEASTRAMANGSIRGRGYQVPLRSPFFGSPPAPYVARRRRL
jgi:hypothetical protein